MPSFLSLTRSARSTEEPKALIATFLPLRSREVLIGESSRLRVGRQRGSIPKHPPRDPHIPLISAVLGKRLLVPEPVRRRAVRQLKQQCCANIVRAIRRADWSAEDEAVTVRREV